MTLKHTKRKHATVKAMQAVERLFATLAWRAVFWRSAAVWLCGVGVLAIVVGIGIFSGVSGRDRAGNDAAVRILRGDRSA